MDVVYISGVVEVTGDGEMKVLKREGTYFCRRNLGNHSLLVLVKKHRNAKEKSIVKGQ